MASVESKIAGAITGVAMAIIVAFVIVPEIKERQAITALNEATAQWAADMERETALMVVRVTRRDGVPSYEQITQGGRPVKCTGNRRL